MTSELRPAGLGKRVYRGLLASGVVARGGSLPYAAGLPTAVAWWVAQFGRTTGRTGSSRKLRLVQSGAWRSGGSDDLETLQAAMSVRMGI